MKQGTLIVRIISIVLFLGVLAYFGVYVWNSTTAESSTATIYTATAENRIEVTGYFFRDEVEVSEHSDMAEVIAAEGERVGTGDMVARIYYSNDGYELQKQLDEAEATLDSLTYILSRMGMAADSATLDDEIVEAFTGIHASVAAGDLSNLDTDTGNLKSLIFRRDYTYSGSESLKADIAETEAEIETLSAQISSAYQTVSAPASGLFSAVTDGYEGIMTTDALTGISPEVLDELVSQQKEVDSSGIGKVILGNGWYFACNIPAEDGKDLYRGVQVQLRFDDATRLFDASVYSVSAKENDELTVVFYSKAYASMVTAMREENADIIIESCTGLRVPKRAIRVDEDGQTGLYRVSGTQAEWVSVTILFEEDDYYLVEQAPYLDEDGNEITMSSFQRATQLREGDTIVVKGGSIYDGKVIGD